MKVTFFRVLTLATCCLSFSLWSCYQNKASHDSIVKAGVLEGTEPSQLDDGEILPIGDELNGDTSPSGENVDVTPITEEPPLTVEPIDSGDSSSGGGDLPQDGQKSWVDTCLEARLAELGSSSNKIDMAEKALISQYRSSVTCIVTYPSSWGNGCQAGTDNPSVPVEACTATCKKFEEYDFAGLPPGASYFKFDGSNWNKLK